MKLGEIIEVKSYKHHGLLHRTWSNGVLLFASDDYFLVGSIQTMITETSGNVWHTREPAITLYARNDWFNVVCMFKENGVSYYANIASPTVYDEKENVLKFVDYDMDIRMDSQGKVRVVDMAEYQINRKQLKYPADLETVLQKTVLELIDHAKEKAYPFDEQLYRQYLDKLVK